MLNDNLLIFVRFWPVIDDALKKAAIERKVKVKLLISWWTHSRKSESYFLDSLMAISNTYEGYSIEVVNCIHKCLSIFYIRK